MAMLRQAVDDRVPGLQVRADSGRLPLPDGSADAVVAVDTFLFADEVARVLADRGALVWVNLLGADGPLDVPIEVVGDAFPGSWEAVSSDAGWGTWSVLRRT